jgi:hypothetical protein
MKRPSQKDCIRSSERHSFRHRLVRALTLCCIAALTLMAVGQEPGQKTFRTPQDASRSLLAAVKTDKPAAIEEVLGASSREIVSSGDPVQDEKVRKAFISRFEQMNRISKTADGSRRLYIGADNWPFPILLKQAHGRWYFDTPAGKEEILYRRIGRNEFAAMRVLMVLFDAQQEYHAEFKQYAQKLMSSNGRKDGLYWKTAKGEPESPVGPLVAHAAAEGYQHRDQPQPFHGYFFRLLKQQGRNAKGGAKNYVSKGKMTRGFGVVAFPADYRNSGVMTFLINQDGKLYQKDLGEKTAEIGKKMTAFNPDKTWTLVPMNEWLADID